MIYSFAYNLNIYSCNLDSFSYIVDSLVVQFSQHNFVWQKLESSFNQTNINNWKFNLEIIQNENQVEFFFRYISNFTPKVPIF